MKGAAPGPLSWGRSHFCSLGWVSCAKWECSPVIYADIYRKHTGLFIHKIEEQHVFALAGLWGSSQGSVADRNHF